MDHLPNDPAILVSSVNMLLRDGEYDSLEEVCKCFDRDPAEITKLLHDAGYEYCAAQRQIRPIGIKGL